MLYPHTSSPPSPSLLLSIHQLNILAPAADAADAAARSPADIRTNPVVRTQTSVTNIIMEFSTRPRSYDDAGTVDPANEADYGLKRRKISKSDQANEDSEQDGRRWLKRKSDEGLRTAKKSKENSVFFIKGIIYQIF